MRLITGQAGLFTLDTNRWCIHFYPRKYWKRWGFDYTLFEDFIGCFFIGPFAMIVWYT